MINASVASGNFKLPQGYDLEHHLPLVILCTVHVLLETGVEKNLGNALRRSVPFELLRNFMRCV